MNSTCVRPVGAASASLPDDPVVGPTLGSLALGLQAVISGLTGDPGTRLRLMELGFTPGQSVTPLARLPFGGPIGVAIRGTIFALRRDEASCILV